MRYFLLLTITVMFLNYAGKPCYSQNYTTFGEIRDIAARGSNLWLATNTGIILYDPINGTKIKYGRSDGFISSRASVVTVAPDGNIWAGFDEHGSVTSFDGEQWQVYSTNQESGANGIQSIAFDSHGNVWVANFGKGVYMFDGTTWIQCLARDTDDTLPPDETDDTNPCSIIVDKNDNVWVGMLHGSVYKYDGISWDLILEPFDTFDSQSITDMQIDSNGILWVSKLYQGILSYDGTVWKKYTIEDGLISNSVRCLRIGPENTLWIGTMSGISVFDGSTWTSYQDEIPSQYHAVTSMAFDENDTLWMADTYDTTNGGTCAPISFDGYKWKRYQGGNQIAGNHIYDLYVDENNTIWAANNGGVSKYDGMTWETFSSFEQASDTEIQYIEGFSNQNIWIGKWGVGVYHLVDGLWQLYTSENGLSDNFISAMAVRSDGTIWVGTVRTRGINNSRNGSLNWFDGSSWHQCYGTDGVSSGVKTIAIDEQAGRVWFGTFDGLYCYDDEGLKKYTTSDGLLDDSIDAIGVDRDGVVWISSLWGITKLGDNSVKIFNDEMFLGLCGNSIIQDDDGCIWVGGSFGLLRYDGNRWVWYETESGEKIIDITSLSKSSGDVVIGTETGIYIYSNSFSVFPKVVASNSVTYTEEQTPITFNGLKSFPNPFNSSITISFTLPEGGFTELIIYNLTGQKIRTLVSGELSHGVHELVWDGCDDSGIPVSSGIFISRLVTGDTVKTNKMTLVK